MLLSLDNFNLKDKMGLAPIHHAVIKRDVASLSEVLKGGADVDASDSQDRTALQLTGYPNNAKKCAKVLKAHAAMAGSKDFGKRSKDLRLNRDESIFLSARRQSRPEASAAH